MTLFRIALRQQRTGLIAMTLLGVVFGVLNALGFVQVAGTSQAERLAFARSMEILGAQLSYMLPVPEHLDTLAGYLQWRAFGSLVLILGIWGVISSTGGGRGDEERGLVEQWLSAGASRARYVTTRVLVFILVATFAIVATMVFTYVAGTSAGEPLPLAGMASIGLDLLITTLACFGIGLIVAQLVTTRRAAGFGAAGLVIALFLINGASRRSRSPRSFGAISEVQRSLACRRRAARQRRHPVTSCCAFRSSRYFVSSGCGSRPGSSVLRL